MGAACSGHTIPHKVLLTGSQGSGKTTLLYFWCLGRLTEPLPTESFNVELIQTTNGATLLVWDVSDPARRRQFYHGTEAVVFVFGGNTKLDSSTVMAELKILLNDRDLHNLPVLLVSSEHDLREEFFEKSDMMEQLDFTKHRGHREYVTVRKDDPETYSEALSKLCDIMHL